ncbi:hypothetical protein D9756_003034 [Leucocoprinus leucothites]|uniref:Uncharacterized protein n=1 Tax=Leucocoprinus leucothites TaxID=201217 RepID=A0A8H5G6J1_9AGAR|nr:hypothetical protein D9756_003034 [Leucoagaricus leucothites]
MPASAEGRKKYNFAEAWKKIRFVDHQTIDEVTQRIRLLAKKHFDYNKKWTEQAPTKPQDAWNELCEYFPEIVIHGKALQKHTIAYMRAIFTNRRSKWRTRQRRLSQTASVQIKIEELEPEEIAAEVDCDYDIGGKVLNNQLFLFQGSVGMPIHDQFLPSPAKISPLRWGDSWL